MGPVVSIFFPRKSADGNVTKVLKISDSFIFDTLFVQNTIIQNFLPDEYKGIEIHVQKVLKSLKKKK